MARRSRGTRGQRRRRGARGGTLGARPVHASSLSALLLVGGAFAGGVYLLLIDTTSLPELYTGAAITLLAVLALAAAHARGFAEASFAPRWLLRAWRPFARIPVDVVALSLAALAQLVRPAQRRGRFVAVPFAGDSHGGGDGATADGGEGGGSGAHREAARERAYARNFGRRALAQALGCVSPNTIVLGVDTSRRLIVAHQLRPRVDSRTIDPMDLG